MAADMSSGRLEMVGDCHSGMPPWHIEALRHTLTVNREQLGQLRTLAPNCTVGRDVPRALRPAISATVQSTVSLSRVA